MWVYFDLPSGVRTGLKPWVNLCIYGTLSWVCVFRQGCCVTVFSGSRLNFRWTTCQSFKRWISRIKLNISTKIKEILVVIVKLKETVESGVNILPWFSVFFYVRCNLTATIVGALVQVWTLSHSLSIALHSQVIFRLTNMTLFLLSAIFVNY